MTTFNPETGYILSQLKTFATLCATFSARVRELARELVRELNGEYGLRGVFHTNNSDKMTKYQNGSIHVLYVISVGPEDAV